jgi:hypothetical protein
MKTIRFNNKKVLEDTIHIDGIEMRDYPDFTDAYVKGAKYKDGTELTEDELVEFSDNNGELIQAIILQKLLFHQTI